MNYFIESNERLRFDASSRSALRGDFISLSDGITHYELTGPKDGELVVLVGGLTVPLFYWDRFSEKLHQCGYQTLAYSNYGRGYSDRIQATNYNNALFVRQLNEIITALGIDKHYHIIGASMGALIAMEHTCQNSSAVATLTIAGPAGLSQQPKLIRWLLRNNYIAQLVAKRLGRKWLQSHEDSDLGDKTHAKELSTMLRDSFQYEGSIHAIFDTLQNFRLFGRQELYRSVAKSNVPTMLIWGKDDQVTPIDSLDAARGLLHPQHCHVANCGHMVPFERPDIVTAQFESFLTKSREGIVS